MSSINFSPTPQQLAIVAMVREADARHMELHGRRTNWIYASPDVFVTLAEGMGVALPTGVKMAVVSGVVLWCNPKLPGVSVCSVAGRGDGDGSLPYKL